MTHNVNLSRIQYFVAVVEAGSFTAAAQRLRVNKAVVSHQIAKLEEELQVALLIRTTRSVSPSEAGQRFFANCVEILRISQDAISQLDPAGGQLTGRLHVAAPVELARSIVVPAVRDYLHAYPEMKVDLSIEDRLANLVEEQIDISIRVGWLTDSTIRSRKVGEFEQWLVSASDMPGVPDKVSHPDDLSGLPWITNRSLKANLVYQFQRSAERAEIAVNSVVETTTTTAGYVSSLSGLGLTVLPDFLVSADVAEGRLRRLLPEWTLPVGGIYILFPPSRYKPNKVILFERILEANLAQGLASG